MTQRIIAIHGLGLIGGSLGLALRALPDPPRVLGYDTDPGSARQALERGAVDALLAGPDSAEPPADLVVTAVPPRVATGLIPRLAGSLPRGAMLTDLSSVMLPVLAALGPSAGVTRRFVGSHPLRGSEQGGIGSARGDLFAGASVIVGAPLEPGSPAEKVALMWRSVGARPAAMAPAIHDALVALTSHLPQVVSVALVRTLRRTGSMTGLLAQGAGPGLRDMSRLAASPSDLWFDILTLNAEKITPALALFERELRGLRHAIGQKDPALRKVLEEAREFRREVAP
ncbi:MAG TPA: prephenate dehydrogenase [Candidatus Limnocylindrales bacterium]|nr:prephenate dehydrogenase [Candidatus Limnocylindrales bacterium]